MDKVEKWNDHVTHPLQAYEWGEFRERTGIKVVRQEGLQVTIHPIPYTPYTIGYCPKGGMPNSEMGKALHQIAIENNCILIKCEPKVELDKSFSGLQMKKLGFCVGRSLFTKYNFVLDVTPSEVTLLAQMKQKTRYNIRLAEKKGVTVELDNSAAAFERYLELTKETTERQGFYAHGEKYHRLMWETIGQQTNHDKSVSPNRLSAHMITARYKGEIITTWVLFRFKDTLYYPYGASTRANREVMANNLVMWEVIKLAKQWGLKYLDMWGALGPEPDHNDPWIGFHNFKLGYGARLVEYIGTWDYVEKPLLYKIYTMTDKLRWQVLRKLK